MCGDTISIYCITDAVCETSNGICVATDAVCNIGKCIKFAFKRNVNLFADPCIQNLHNKPKHGLKDLFTAVWTGGNSCPAEPPRQATSRIRGRKRMGADAGVYPRSGLAGRSTGEARAPPGLFFSQGYFSRFTFSDQCQVNGPERRLPKISG